MAITETLVGLAYDEDLHLVDRFLKGDQTAFQTLYEKYYERVYTIARGILIDSEEAKDVVQEVFTLVFRHTKRFDHRAKFHTWLFRIAVNRSIQQSRSNKHRRRNLPLTEASEQYAESSVPEIADPIVKATLEGIPAADRAVLTLYYWDELSLQEMAEALCCSTNAAKTRLFRARERFRRAYEGVPA